jgi:hypothetical protein
MKTLKLALPLVVLALVGCGGDSTPTRPVEVKYSTEKVELNGDLAGCTVHLVDVISYTNSDRRLNIVKCKNVDSTSANYIERIGKRSYSSTVVSIDENKSQVAAKLSDSAKELIGIKPTCDLSHLVPSGLVAAANGMTAKAAAAVKEIENLSYEEKVALGVCK